MKRKQLIYLNKWLSRSKRKPLILRGARQVGKSTLVKLLAEHQNKLLVDVNLERYPELNDEFKKKNPYNLINIFEALSRVPTINQDSILFLDEIQSTPEAIPALRYFYEDLPELPLLAAGSLLEFILSDHQFSMPVGRVEYLHMGPMTFTEFLDALGEAKLLSVIQSFQIGDEINNIIHKRLLELLRSYFFVGGMPEAVEVFADSKRYSEVRKIHDSIIDTYREDFPKYIGSRNLPRIQHVFNFSARNVGQKVKYSHFSSDDKSATIKKDIELLCMAKIVSKVVHSHCNGLPIQAEIEDKIYKLIFLDIGLMNTICGLDWVKISQLKDSQLINEGVIAEQFIGQHLADLISNTVNRELTYWLREGKSNNAEVDYVLNIRGEIIPIEVKSNKSGSLKSLHQFMAEKNSPFAIRFDTNLPSLQHVSTTVNLKNKMTPVDYALYTLPLYLVERVQDLEYGDV